MPKKILSQAVNLDIEPHFSPAVRNALNNYLKVVSEGQQKQDEWSNLACGDRRAHALSAHGLFQ